MVARGHRTMPLAPARCHASVGAAFQMLTRPPGTSGGGPFLRPSRAADIVRAPAQHRISEGALMANPRTAIAQGVATALDTEFNRGLGLYDATMVVVGSMIGSGIFIVSADMARQLGSPGWLLVAWVVTGVLTITAALSYGELAAMMPRAGGQYVYLREAFSPLWGFLYGWTLFLVIQTGTIAAVAVAFARFLGVLWPAIGEEHYIIAPVHLTTAYAVSLSTAQLVGVLLIAILTWSNPRGLEYGKIVQNIF